MMSLPILSQSVSPYALVPFLILGYAWFMSDAAERGATSLAGRLVKKKALMTPNEKEFFGRLTRAVKGDYTLMSQVAMGAVMEAALPKEHPQFWEVRKLFSQKIIDYLLCDKKTLAVIAAIELDDRTHDKEKDVKRDALMHSAGIPTLRWESRSKPSEQQIRTAIKALVDAKVSTS